MNKTIITSLFFSWLTNTGIANAVIEINQKTIGTWKNWN